MNPLAMASEPISGSYTPTQKPVRPDNSFGAGDYRDSGTSNMSIALSPAFPLASLLWPGRGNPSQWVMLPLVLMIAVLFRWITGLWSYSGFASPPMFGDFEAQRHWMELTIHLPITRWYFHDLEWWGLDYPPLTAYHSWLLGKFGNYIQPSWFALYSSRGLDDSRLKIFMRSTVLASEYAVLVPSVILFCRRLAGLHRLPRLEVLAALIAIIMQPGNMLIDHGHFQYNTVMLGLFVASLTCLVSNRMGWGCFFFVTALTFKQMALYYAPVIFAYILGTCLRAKNPLVSFMKVASITGLSFILIFLPFILGALFESGEGFPNNIEEPYLVRLSGLSRNSILFGPVLQLGQSIHRIFPFTRGLFEDKVANFWCAVHTFHKLHNYSTSLLQKISLGMTVTAILPPSITIFMYPDRNLLAVASATSAWGFFLFSFQVHEKSVLLPLLPMSLLLVTERGLLPERRSWIAWANILACWTLYPLLKREQLQVPYFTLTLLWAWLMGVPSTLLKAENSESTVVDLLTRLTHASFYALMAVWHVCESTIPPPSGKPDFWTVINVLIGVTGFSLCYMWCLFHLLYPFTKRTRHANTTNPTEPKYKKQ